MSIACREMGGETTYVLDELVELERVENVDRVVEVHGGRVELLAYVRDGLLRVVRGVDDVVLQGVDLLEQLAVAVEAPLAAVL